MSDILAQIAQDREERVKDLHLDLPIPSWDRGLVGRFTILPRKEMEQFATRKAGTESDMDFIIRATTELYVLDPDNTSEGKRNEDDDSYVRIEDENGNTVTWTAALAEKVGHPELAKARDVLNYCFKGNTIAVGGFAVKLVRWMQNTDLEVADAISGE